MTDSLSLTLKDDRKMGYQLLGDADGYPLFFFHGTPGSRLVLSENDLLAQIDGLRLILPERPGYGISTPQPERTLLGWADDVAELADSLGLSTFSVAGASGGGPHALACAYSLPNRINKTLLLSSPSPMNFKSATRGMALGNRLGFLLNRYAPGLAARILRSQAKSVQTNPDGFMDAMVQQMGEQDRKLMAKPFVRDAILQDVREAFKQGADGAIADSQVVSAAWGFRLEDIKAQIYMWHGLGDTLVTERMARHLAEALPNCRANFVRNAAHLLTEEPNVIREIEQIVLGEQ